MAWHLISFPERLALQRSSVHEGGSGPVLPALDAALGVADDLNHALAGVRRAQRLGELLVDPEPHQGQRVVEPLAQRAPGVGPAAVELRCEQLEPLACELRVGQGPRRPDPGPDPIALRLGQQLADVALSLKKGPLSSMKERAVSSGGHGPRMVGRPG